MNLYGEARTPAEVEADERVLARVKRGIKLLEQEYGEDWASKVDLDTLDLSDSGCCVLGQLDRNYWTGRDRLITEQGMGRPERYGFTIGEDDVGEPHQAWRRLQWAWVDAIISHPGRTP